jgi:ZIP family zinc transporter
LTGLEQALLYSAVAGATIPVGGFLARVERIRPLWLEREMRHTVIAFGGGVLLAAIALVLVPEGAAALPIWATLSAFGVGGLVFFLIERLIEKRGGEGAQFLAMLLDFVPESMALGAMLATEKAAGVLLAFLIALQNLPEGFNAYREILAIGKVRPRTLILSFCALALLGPFAAWIGFEILRDAPAALGALMLFAAGGILYLTFGTIAPQARLERHWAPPLGAVGGFMLGMLGNALVA